MEGCRYENELKNQNRNHAYYSYYLANASYGVHKYKPSWGKDDRPLHSSYDWN